MKKWNSIPKFMRNKDVKYYYDILKKRKISLFLKRLFDIVGSLLGLIIFSPIMGVLMVSIKIDSKGPIFYRQERITRYGKKFKIFKFRTMVINADKIGGLVTLKNDSRITKVGNLIRKCRLDEFPQLINVLIGDMSFVGTRPEVEKYVKKYSNQMNATLLMRAGITSNASIEYRNEDKIINKYLKKGEIIDDIYVKRVLPEKMKYNLKDIEKFNIFRELKICINTVIAVLK